MPDCIDAGKMLAAAAAAAAADHNGSSLKDDGVIGYS
jgi:hypothetical protein